ncbi:hypothetical protein [Burkholderia latens]|uniref:hypothetical protein n=1 Tax=Burkholderia latens TaxID=488446 RepID=UPI0039A54A02
MNRYPIWLIRRKHGGEIDPVAARHLEDCGYPYSARLRGYVVSRTGLPWSFAAFVPMHDLEVIEETITYTERNDLAVHVPLEILREEQAHLDQRTE